MSQESAKSEAKEEGAKQAAPEAPKYKARIKGFLDGKIVEKDSQFSYEGPVGAWMEPVNSAAKAKVDAYQSKRKAAAAALAKAPPSCRHCGQALPVEAEAGPSNAKPTNIVPPPPGKDDPNTHGTVPKGANKNKKADGGADSKES